MWYRGGVVFCAVIREVELSYGHNYLNCCCDSLQRSQWNFMSMELVLRLTMVSLVTPTAVELSHSIVVWGCGHPIFMSAWRSETIYLAMVKRPDSSASEADDMTFLIICAVVRTGPLRMGIRNYSVSVMLAPERLRACDTLR